MAGFYGEIGGSLRKAKQGFRQAILEYDQAIASGAESRLHRVAHWLFGPSLRRKSFDAFASGDAPLSAFPAAFLALQRYALSNIVERSVEGIHARIKAIGQPMHFVSVPYLCARLREDANIDKLRSDPDFYEFCLKHWRTKRLADTILSQRFSTADLHGAGYNPKVKRVYQCSLADDLENMDAARVESAKWVNATAMQRQAIEAPLTDVWLQSVEYLRGLFEGSRQVLFCPVCYLGTSFRQLEASPEHFAGDRSATGRSCNGSSVQSGSC